MNNHHLIFTTLKCPKCDHILTAGTSEEWEFMCRICLSKGKEVLMAKMYDEELLKDGQEGGPEG